MDTLEDIRKVFDNRKIVLLKELTKIHEEINRKEMKMAIMSALAATARMEFVKRRGHAFELGYVPVIVVNEFENIHPYILNIVIRYH